MFDQRGFHHFLCHRPGQILNLGLRSPFPARYDRTFLCRLMLRVQPNKDKSLAFNSTIPSSPHLLQWNLTVEQQLTPNTAFTISYVGTRGIHLYTTDEANPCDPVSVTNGVPYYGATACASHRNNFGGPGLLPAPWDDAIFTTTGANSSYHALQATLTKRLSHGLEITGAYTWSHVLNSTQGLFFASECNATAATVGVRTAVREFPMPTTYTTTVRHALISRTTCGYRFCTTCQL